MAARSTTPPEERPAGPPINPRAAGSDEGGYAPVFWTAFNRSANPMALVDLARRIVAANPASARVVGRSPERLVGETVAHLLDDPDEALDEDAWRARVLGDESFGSRRLRRPDGTTRIVDFAMRGTRVNGRLLVLVVCLNERAGRERRRPHDPAPLTAREREIIHRIALGDVTAEICAELHIAPDTVRNHVRNAMAKTGARTRAQLIAIALGERLLDQ
jgi:PAS domain S-box-containing protein